MPIVDERMARGDYVPYYEEREITAPVDLCDERGRLNDAARGWSRAPLTRANLSGHWPRKKKWNFWNWISPKFVFSVTVADIDFASFCGVSFTDFETRENFSGMALGRHGHTAMPEEVEKSIFWKSKGVDYSFDHQGDRILVKYRGPLMKGGEAAADFVIHKPKGHETLNIVAPWSDERFQMNSKHNTLPCEGSVTVRGSNYLMDPAECHGVQDFGRGMWPYRSCWNWGVLTGHAGADVIGVNMGAKWTTGTGANENGICLNGRLYKVMEDLDWEYDAGDFMKPWRVRAPHSKMIDLTLTPTIANATNLSLGVMRTGGTCSFGRWNGIVRCDGREIGIKNVVGWAEEFEHRW
jgi:hypothetical protein